MSKTTWVLFGIAALCYSLEWAEAAVGLGAVGIMFELFMYISMCADHNEVKMQKSEENVKGDSSDINKNT